MSEKRYVIKVKLRERHGQAVLAERDLDVPTAVTFFPFYWSSQPGERQRIDDLNRDVMKAMAQGLRDAGWEAWVEVEEKVSTPI